jgi:nucleotide-binding universal stress UspA family protein
MYRRIVLAFDSTVAGRSTLREGALLAKRCGAEVFLLSVVADSSSVTIVEGIQAGVMEMHLDAHRAILADGLAKLEQLGFRPLGKLVRGDPAQQVSDYAREVKADLVVVGHRKRSFLERWWTGNGYIVDSIDCSLLVARREISDAAFEAEFFGPE